jgi:hypothetical protein
MANDIERILSVMRELKEVSGTQAGPNKVPDDKTGAAARTAKFTIKFADGSQSETVTASYFSYDEHDGAYDFFLEEEGEEEIVVTVPRDMVRIIMRRNDG